MLCFVAQSFAWKNILTPYWQTVHNIHSDGRPSPSSTHLHSSVGTGVSVPAGSRLTHSSSSLLLLLLLSLSEGGCSVLVRLVRLWSTVSDTKPWLHSLYMSVQTTYEMGGIPGR